MTSCVARRIRLASLPAAVSLLLGACPFATPVCGCPRDAGAATDDVEARFTLVSETACTGAQLEAGCENLAPPRR